MQEWYNEEGPSGELNHIRLRFEASYGGFTVWRVAKIWVWYSCRRQGIGNKLMQKVCEDADREGIVLKLEVQAWSQNCMSDRDLVRWYSSWGFERESGMRMVRHPRSPYSVVPGSRVAPPYPTYL